MSSVQVTPSGIMEILLLEDVTGIGKKNDLLVVGDGFALNFLLPQRKALVATPTVRKRYADQIRKRAEEKEHEKQLQADAAQAIAGKTVTFARKASKTGKLYAAIAEEQISKALAEQHSLTVAADAILLPEPIKMTGTFAVQVKMGAVQSTLSVVVTPQQ